MDNENINGLRELTEEQLSLLERNLKLTVDERLNQLQSAVSFIEELRFAVRNLNGN